MERHATGFPAPALDQGRLITIDDCDSDDAGRDAIVQSFRAALAARGLLTCDLDALNKKAKAPFFPHGDDPFFNGHDAIFVSQPTFSGIGLTIRGEIMGNKAYDAQTTAWASALDRQVLYERTVLPFLHSKPKRVVLQMRGLMSSLAHQTLQSEDEGHPLSIEGLLRLPGNRLELSRRPDLIILLTRKPESRLSERYHSPDVLEIFRGLGSRIVFVDAKRREPEVAADYLKALNALFPVP